jgi:hypothetical protein
MRPRWRGPTGRRRSRACCRVRPHYGFTIDVLAAYRPTGKSRVKRQVTIIVREHVIAGRSFDSVAELDGAFLGGLPIRRRQVHRTHGEVGSVGRTEPLCSRYRSGLMW